MRTVFVSNYINHHQLPFCRAMDEISPNGDFVFIQTMPMEEKRIQMGWGVDPKSFSFVKLYYEEEEECKRLILDSDVVIFGWSEGMISDLEQERLSSGKLSFRVSERIYREGQWKFISPNGLVHKYREHIRYRKMPVYLLCAGAYVASDFNLIKSYPGKMLKWGYFPVGDNSSFAKESTDKKVKLCWAGRLIDLKHPEFAIKLAHTLKEKGMDFELEIIGDGVLKTDLEKMAIDEGLSKEISFTGNLEPSEVRKHMQIAHIFLFTSNYLEGWGAVVNEAMLSGCAVVASREAGAVPFLIKDGENSLSYENGSYADFEAKVLYLFENKDKIHEFGCAAQKTIKDKWNGQNAAAEFVRFCREFYENKNPKMAEDGPMSKAPIYKPAGFFRTMQEKNKLE